MPKTHVRFQTEAPDEEDKDLTHVWVVAAEVSVEPRIASIADFRKSFKASAGQRIDALEVYCKGCRRPYEKVKGMRVCWVEHSEPWDLESDLLSRLDLPLNLSQNHHNAFHDRLKALRAEARHLARELPISA